MTEQRLNIRRVLWLLRQRRSFVAAFVLVGALIPTALIFSRPTSYSATSLVLVPNFGSSSSTQGASGSGAPSANSNLTDSEIAVSSAVLDTARSRVRPALTLQAAQKHVTASAVATNLVQIKATGSSPGAAEALANAVANRLVVFLTSSEVSGGQSGLSGLEAQSYEWTNQVNKYDQEIQAAQAAIASAGATSASGQQNTALLGSLMTLRADASLQVQSVNSQIAASKLNIAAANAGTEVIQSASSAVSPSLVSRLLPALVGAVLGLLIGSAIVLTRHRESDHLMTRDEIAEAAGVPVLLSMTVGHLNKSSQWLALLREHEPAVTELWNVRKVLSNLDMPEVGQQVLTVVTLAGDSSSVAAVAHFAVASATTGIPTSLVLTSDDSGSRGLRDACDSLTALHEEARPNLRLVKGSPPVDDAEGSLTIISIVLNPDEPKLPAFVARGMVVLAISAGFVDEEHLVRVLLAVGDEGLPIKGLLVTNPMDDDRTLGTFPNMNEQVTHLLQRRTVEHWPGGADAL